jgi:hypothetical protein
MNTIAKFVAPAVLALAAFGAQASQVTPKDIGFSPVVAGTASKMTSIVGAPSGERAFGQVNTVPAAKSTGTVGQPAVIATPVRAMVVVGA